MTIREIITGLVEWFASWWLSFIEFLDETSRAVTNADSVLDLTIFQALYWVLASVLVAVFPWLVLASPFIFLVWIIFYDSKGDRRKWWSRGRDDPDSKDRSNDYN